MKPTFKKLEVKDLGHLQQLVAENIEGIERGLRVIDSRLMLGQGVIDLVALDVDESLVLIALDFAAEDRLLFRVMDAYSWCLEYSSTLGRFYPMARVSAARPPRILLIVERLTDTFLRRVKQLSPIGIDCLEFRHLEVNGTSALYFELVERLGGVTTPPERRRARPSDAETRVEEEGAAMQARPARPAPQILEALSAWVAAHPEGRAVLSQLGPAAPTPPAAAAATMAGRQEREALNLPASGLPPRWLEFLNLLVENARNTETTQREARDGSVTNG